MPFFTNDMPIKVEDVEAWEEARGQRIETYKTMYSQDTAQKLIDAATHYHWVNPQLTAALILNGADYLMPEVADIAAEKMAEAGMAPGDRWKNQRLMNAFISKKNGKVK
jgi:hypothetical protein